MDIDINDFCGRCIHARTSLESGTHCGLTEGKRDLSRGCADLVVDPAKEKRNAEAEERRRRILDMPETPMDDTEVFDQQGRFRWRGLFGVLALLVVIAAKILSRMMD